MNQDVLITIPGPEAIKILESLYPAPPVSPTPTEDIHMMLFGHTRNIVKPISEKK